MAYENYTIKQFQNALFKKDRSIMNEEEFKTVYNEYIDTAGLYESEQFNKATYAHYLTNRINSVKMSIKLQKEFISEFGIPFIEGFSFFKRFGYSVYWNSNFENFFEQLKKIELKENKYISKLEQVVKEIIELKEKKNKKEKTVEQTRGEFVKTLNSLRKVGHTVKIEETTVEELAWMIKDETKNN